jgi:hypothetical protein
LGRAAGRQRRPRDAEAHAHQQPGDAGAQHANAKDRSCSRGRSRFSMTRRCSIQACSSAAAGAAGQHVVKRTNETLHECRILLWVSHSYLTTEIPRLCMLPTGEDGAELGLGLAAVLDSLAHVAAPIATAGGVAGRGSDGGRRCRAFNLRLHAPGIWPPQARLLSGGPVRRT